MCLFCGCDCGSAFCSAECRLDYDMSGEQHQPDPYTVEPVWDRDFGYIG